MAAVRFPDSILALLLASLAATSAGCADPPVELPESSPFPTDDVQLGMTFGELSLVRPSVWVDPDSGVVVEEFFGGRFHFGFTSQRGHRPPTRRSKLIYIDRLDEELRGNRAESRWDSLVVALAGELEVEAECSAIEYGRLTWRRVTLRREGAAVAASVELQAVTIGDPGPGSAQVTTRAWLTDYAFRGRGLHRTAAGGGESVAALGALRGRAPRLVVHESPVA